MKCIIRIFAVVLCLAMLCLTLSACNVPKSTVKRYTYTFNVNQGGNVNWMDPTAKTLTYEYAMSEGGGYSLTATVVKQDGKTDSQIQESGTYYITEENGKSKITFTYYEGEKEMTHTYDYESGSGYIEVGDIRYTEVYE